MRIVFLERDNVTRLSESGNNNDDYSASFELYPFYEGSSYSFYKGLMNGDGHLRGQFGVVRAMLDTVAEEKDWADMMRRATEAQKLAKEFNKYLGYKAITFQIPMLTQMKRVSDLACLFRWLKPHDKRLKVNEFVTIEPFIEGMFQRFDANLGPSAAVQIIPKSKTENCGDNKGGKKIFHETGVAEECYTTRENITSVAQAFSHFTWHFTKNLVVCNLQGVNNGHGYTLTNPIIHSTDSKFGSLDGSTHSIAEFFSYHRCNNICSKWETCGNTGKPQSLINFLL